jgi:protein SCO1/2
MQRITKNDGVKFVKMKDLFGKMPFALVVITILILAYENNAPQAQVVSNNPSELKGIDIEEHLNSNIPLDFHFIDDRGDSVKLSKYFHRKKPIILIMGYYSCPMLCGLVMNAVSETVPKVPLTFGKDYQIVSVSIDTAETDVIASAKKKEHLKQIGVPENSDSWMFLTGEGSQSQGLADAIGFKYYYDEKKEMYAHAAVLVILTEDGTISRYLYGIQYNPNDLRLALLEAAQGKVGSTIDRIILYCYHYDPQAGGYVIFAGNVMRAGGAITLIAVAIFVGILWYRDRRKKAAAKSGRGGGV